MKLTRFVVGPAVILGLLLAGAAVRAGLKTENNVSITTFSTYRTGSGSMGTARAAADANQQIGCGVEATTSGNFARCKARTSAGTYLECTTGSAAIVQAAASIGPASRIYFIENLSGSCTALHVTNTSDWKPMVP